MQLKLNPAPPEVMWIDFNAFFARAEQQANPFLRGKPVGVTNRGAQQFATIVAPSYEAKRLGVKCGTRVREARWKAPGIHILETDPAKYVHLHKRLHTLLSEYAPVEMKSIDEGVLDFRGLAGVLKGRSLEDIGYEIKDRVREELGDWMSVNVGIAPNRFLAKVAASLRKPDGLDTIAAADIEGACALLELMDLPGINTSYKARLNLAGIYTPYEFLQADEQTLNGHVFKSINGRHWFLRLRGYEVDDVHFGTKTVGRQYVLSDKTDDREELSRVIYWLCLKIADKLRLQGFAARGMLIGARMGKKPRPGEPPFWNTYWQERAMWPAPTRTGRELHERTWTLFQTAPPLAVRDLRISAYGLVPAAHEQLRLHDTQRAVEERLQRAYDAVNDRYGDMTLRPGVLAGMRNTITDKVPFGTTRYFDLLKEGSG